MGPPAIIQNRHLAVFRYDISYAKLLFMNNEPLPVPTSPSTAGLAPSAHQGSKHPDGRVIISFVAGLVVGICLVIAYALATGIISLSARPVTVSNAGKVSTPRTTPTPVGNTTKVTDEDLKNYVEPKDCRTLSQYSTLSLTVSKQAMKSINIKAGSIETGSELGTWYNYWEKLPTVVDANCNEIKITDIQAGDVLNVYTKSVTTGYGTASKTVLIQKVK